MGTRLWTLVSIVCLLSLSEGCSQIESHPTSVEFSPKQGSTSQKMEQESSPYLPSSIEPEFPVPKQAQKTNHQAKKATKKYVRYAYQNLTDPKVRSTYFAEIKNWGWVEEKEEQMGSMHVFTKGEKQIQMTVHQTFFTLFINQNGEK